MGTGKQSEAIKCLFDILKDNKFHDDKSKAKVQPNMQTG